MKFLVRFECAQCDKTVEMFAEVEIYTDADTNSLGTTTYESSLNPRELPQNWVRENKCGSCP